MSNTKVKFVTAYASQLDSIPIINGQIIYLSDSSQIYFDMNNVRKPSSDIIEMPNEEAIKAILTPLNKLYIAKDVGTLWKYLNTGWVCISGSNGISDITLNGSSRGITKTDQKVNIDVLWAEF
jgi:hypothetical protein